MRAQNRIDLRILCLVLAILRVAVSFGAIRIVCYPVMKLLSVIGGGWGCTLVQQVDGLERLTGAPTEGNAQLANVPAAILL